MEGDCHCVYRFTETFNREGDYNYQFHQVFEQMYLQWAIKSSMVGQKVVWNVHRKLLNVMKDVMGWLLRQSVCDDWWHELLSGNQLLKWCPCEFQTPGLAFDHSEHFVYVVHSNQIVLHRHWLYCKFCKSGVAQYQRDISCHFSGTTAQYSEKYSPENSDADKDQ